MILKVQDNLLFCKSLNAQINHMECDDECRFFKGCAVIDGSFVIDCGYNKIIAEIEQDQTDLVQSVNH